MHIRKNREYQMNIDFNNFKKIAPNSTDPILKFTGKELVHAIATCGVINPLNEIDLEFKYKKYALECQFKEKKGELFLSDKYDYMDPSEKKCLSYYRGMFFGRLIAYKRFDLNVFIHLSTCENRLKMILTRIPIKKGDPEPMDPDIIAWNKKDEYYVWECKGYKNGLKNGKIQANKITRVNGNNVKGNIVSAIYANSKRKIFATVNDPDDKGIEIQLDINKALHFYYSPIVSLIQNNPTNNSNNIMQFGKIKMDKEEYTFGVPKDIFECVLNNEKNNNGTLKDIVKKHNLQYFAERENMFGDFIYIN